MSETQGRPSRVAVRELRQNLSVYLDRVKDGERLVVTERGRPVAELTPLSPSALPILERLVLDGRARAAKGNLASLGLPPAIERSAGAPSASAELRAMRDEEPW